MNRTTLLISLCLLIMLSFVSCKSTPDTVKLERVKECTFPDDGKTEAPLWVCDAPVEGIEVSAVGSAAATKAGYDFQRKMAAASARERLAAQMKVTVNEMIKRYAETTGAADSETVDRANTAVSKHITDAQLVGSKVVRNLKNPNTGVLFVLMGIDAKHAKAIAEQAINTSMKNEQALWQKFQAGKAQEELAAGIANMK